MVAPATIASSAGVSNAEPSIVGYRLGQGVVVDIGLPGFGVSLRHNLDAQELLASVWKLLGALTRRHVWTQPYAAVKRRRPNCGCSSSSTIAAARSPEVIALFPASSVAGRSSPRTM